MQAADAICVVYITALDRQLMNQLTDGILMDQRASVPS
jgi:hypothetical protein